MVHKNRDKLATHRPSWSKTKRGKRGKPRLSSAAHATDVFGFLFGAKQTAITCASPACAWSSVRGIPLDFPATFSQQTTVVS